jgi:ferredoxin
MKVRIDQDECIGCAACWTDCPEFFEEGEEEFSQVVEEFRAGGDPMAGKVPANLEDCVQEAADGCPSECIHLEE